MIWLKQSTALSFKMGPFVDQTDGFTPETLLTINRADIQISKNGGAFDQTSEITPVTTHDIDGFYNIPLTVTDTNTIGTLRVQVTVTGARTVVQDFVVVPANVYDSLVSGSDHLFVDTVEISNDAVAADNLELQYNGTGVSGPTYPATQGQVQNILAISSSEVVAANSYTLTTGTLVSGTIGNLLNSDSVYHIHNDSGGTLSLYYDFDVTSHGRATGVTFKGYVQGSNDTIHIDVYNWVSAQFIHAATINGSNNITEVTRTLALTSEFTGQPNTVDIGKVRVRFRGTGLTSAVLGVDQLIVSKITISTRLGYTNNLVWIDTNGSNTGTILDIDGTESDPVNNFTDAQAIAVQFNYSGYGLFPNSSITLTSDSTDLNFVSRGVLWNLNMNGQIMTSAVVNRARVYGSMVNTGFRTRFEDQCIIRNATLANSIIQDGVIDNAQIKYIVSGSTVSFRNCVEAGDGTPAVFDMNFPAATTLLEFFDFFGHLEIRNMNTNAKVEIYGEGRITIDASCTGGTVIAGTSMEVVDNSGGAVTISRPITNQTYDTNIGLIPAIKTKTDKLTFSHQNDLDANIKSINGNDIQGGGNTPAGYV